MDLLARWRKAAPTAATTTVTARWDEERVWHEGDAFFAALASAITGAHASVDLETYIYSPDPFGEEFAAVLAATTARGVAVRLLVDGVGSLAWLRSPGSLTLASAGVAVRVYHPLPLIGGLTRWRPHGLLNALGRINRRDHRKLCVIDGVSAFVGSMNCTAEHLARFSGSAAWRDTGARVAGTAVGELATAFATTWRVSHPFPPPQHHTREPRPIMPPASGLIRLGTTRQQRRALWRDLALRIRTAQTRVWLTTAYFVPRRRLLLALVAAARQGRDVRLLVGERSDHPLMVVVSQAMLHVLRQRGVHVLLYQPRILHAKSVLIDDWATVGSTNLNHRSALHDLEADVVLTSPAAIAALEQGWTSDIQRARTLTEADWHALAGWKRLLGRLMLLMRHWL